MQAWLADQDSSQVGEILRGWPTCLRSKDNKRGQIHVDANSEPCGSAVENVPSFESESLDSLTRACLVVKSR